MAWSRKETCTRNKSISKETIKDKENLYIDKISINKCVDRNVQQVYIDYYVQTDVCVERYVQTNIYVHVQSSMEKSKTVLGLKNGQV